MKTYDFSTLTLEDLVQKWKNRDKHTNSISIESQAVKRELINRRDKEVKLFNQKVKDNPEEYNIYFYSKVIGQNKKYDQELQELKDRWESFELPFDSRSQEQVFFGNTFQVKV